MTLDIGDRHLEMQIIPKSKLPKRFKEWVRDVPEGEWVMMISIRGCELDDVFSVWAFSKEDLEEHLRVMNNKEQGIEGYISRSYKRMLEKEKLSGGIDES